MHGGHGLPCRLENENIEERKKVRERKGKTRRVFSRIALDGKRIVISIDMDRSLRLVEFIIQIIFVAAEAMHHVDVSSSFVDTILIHSSD